jgi:hypothetical protein
LSGEGWGWGCGLGLVPGKREGTRLSGARVSFRPKARRKHTAEPKAQEVRYASCT